jgi:hypothetical protein
MGLGLDALAQPRCPASYLLLPNKKYRTIPIIGRKMIKRHHRIFLFVSMFLLMQSMIAMTSSTKTMSPKIPPKYGIYPPFLIN